MSKRKVDVAIIGAGASGLAAAIELGLKRPEFSVLVIEKMADPGRKLRATGSGRCNISNVNAKGYERICSFFDDIGLVTRSYENGLVYPYSESAADVVDLLLGRAEALGVKFACSEEVTEVKKEDGCFEICSKTKDKDGEHTIKTQANYVILACGGKAGPSYGTTGDGYKLAKELGHSIVTPVPALTGIECEEWSEDASPCAITLGGTRTDCRISLYKKTDESEEKIFEEEGELQFTKYGLSGICVFNMSRHMRYDRTKGESLSDYVVKVDLYPDGDIDEYIKGREGGVFPESDAAQLLLGILKKPLAAYVSERPEGLRESVHALSFRPHSVRGWKDAQLSMGGVALDEIDDKSSESKIAAGLYITGELADRDFECGGYNLSNAWITGLAAADDIAKK